MMSPLQLSRYIEAILHSNNINRSCVGDIAHQHRGNIIHRYYYGHRKIEENQVKQDLIDYIKGQPLPAATRIVCFIVETPAPLNHINILMLKLGNPNLELAKSIHDALNSGNPPPLEGGFLASVRSIYQDVSAGAIGEDVSLSWINLIAPVYNIRPDSFKLFKTPREIANNVFLTEVALQYLSGENIHAESRQLQSYSNNQIASLRQQLAKQLELLERKYSDVYKIITQHVIGLIKHNTLGRDHANLNIDSVWTDKAQLLRKKDIYQNAKQQLFTKSDNEFIPYIVQFLMSTTVENLVEIFSAPNINEQLSKLKLILDQNEKRAAELLKQWENKLTQRITELNIEQQTALNSDEIIPVQQQPEVVPEPPITLSDWLQALSKEQPEKYQLVCEHVVTIMKHHVLRSNREKLKVKDTWESFKDLSEKQQQYLAIKTEIYKQSLVDKVNQHIESIPEQLFRHEQTGEFDINKLTTFLESQITNSLAELTRWENDFFGQVKRLNNNQSWLNSIVISSYSSFNFLYRTTWLGLAAEFSGWLGGKAIDLVVPNQLALNNHYLTRENAKVACKVAGGALGCYLLYQSGSYGLARVMVTNIGSKYCFDLLTHQQLNDKTAVPTASSPMHVDHTIIFNSIHFVIAVCETAYTQNYRYLAQTTGAMLCSLALTQTAKRKIPQLMPNANQQFTQEQALALFLLNIVGFDVGRFLANKGYNFYESLILCEAAKQYFTESMLANNNIIWAFAQCSKPSFWTTDQMPLSLSWRNTAGHLYNTRCTVFQPKPQYPLSICEEPTVSEALNLLDTHYQQ